MNKHYLLLAAILQLLSLSLLAQLDNTFSGDLDTLFGIGGRVLLPFGFATTNPYRVAIQSNGNILVSGVFFFGTDNVRSAVLIRLTPLGKIDYSFSPTGYHLRQNPLTDMLFTLT